MGVGEWTRNGPRGGYERGKEPLGLLCRPSFVSCACAASTMGAPQKVATATQRRQSAGPPFGVGRGSGRRKSATHRARAGRGNTSFSCQLAYSHRLMVRSVTHQPRHRRGRALTAPTCSASVSRINAKMRSNCADWRPRYLDRMEHQIIEIVPPYSVFAIGLIAIDKAFALFQGYHGSLAGLRLFFVHLFVQ